MKQRIAVVGAGVAGLTCAYELQQAGFDVTVFEKRSSVGGRMASRERDGFVFDIGADHLCNLYTHMKAYVEEFGLGWEPMEFLEYGVVKNKEIVSFQKALGPVSKARLAFQFFRTRNIQDFLDLSNLITHDVGDAYSYMTQRTGSEVVDYMIDAFTSTYQFHRAEEISVGALLGIMYSIGKDQDKWYLHHLSGGMQALPNAFAERLQVRLNTPIDSVKASGEQVTVTFEGREEVFDAAVLASTADATQQMYVNPSAPQKYLLEQTNYASTVSVCFKVPRVLLPKTGIVWVPFVESEKISGYVNEAMKGKDTTKDGMSLISTWLHEDYAKTLMNKPDSVIFDDVRKALLDVCPWFASSEQLQPFDLERWESAMPKFSHKHLTRVHTFLDVGQGDNRVYFAGDYMNSPWTEGAIRGGQRAAARITNDLAGAEQ